MFLRVSFLRHKNNIIDRYRHEHGVLCICKTGDTFVSSLLSRDDFSSNGDGGLFRVFSFFFVSSPYGWFAWLGMCVRTNLRQCDYLGLGVIASFCFFFFFFSIIAAFSCAFPVVLLFFFSISLFYSFFQDTLFAGTGKNL